MLEELGLDDWLSKGLMLNINGVRVGEDEPVNDGDEIAYYRRFPVVESRLIDKAEATG